MNAHATSTPLGDRAEARAICETFGDSAKSLLVSSTKSMTGHLLGGAGSLEAGITVLALRDQVAPPMTNLQDVDEACGFCLVRDKGVPTTMEYAMTNSFGFGGTNASLIFRRYHESSLDVEQHSPGCVRQRLARMTLRMCHRIFTVLRLSVEAPIALASPASESAHRKPSAWRAMPSSRVSSLCSHHRSSQHLRFLFFLQAKWSSL